MQRMVIYLTFWTTESQVLQDALFDSQTSDSFYRVCDVKVKGTRHLDQLTRMRCAGSLEHFVAFSSAAAGESESSSLKNKNNR